MTPGLLEQLEDEVPPGEVGRPRMGRQSRGGHSVTHPGETV